MLELSSSKTVSQLESRTSFLFRKSVKIINNINFSAAK